MRECILGSLVCLMGITGMRWLGTRRAMRTLSPELGYLLLVAAFFAKWGGALYVAFSLLGLLTGADL